MCDAEVGPGDRVGAGANGLTGRYAFGHMVAPAAMLFHTTAFIVGFLPVCLAGFFLAGRYGGQTSALCWMVAASSFFYAWWNPAYLPLLVGSVLVNHAIARRSRRGRSPRKWLAAGIALNLLLLGWFKYADFLLHIVAPGASSLGIILPLAISFFTFQQIMFQVDAARADPRQGLPHLLPYAAFVTFFPHLIAGPIVRPAEIIPQLTRRGSRGRRSTTSPTAC